MYYIVGLGNPGAQYATTRHNVGWMVLDSWLAATGLPTVYESAQCAGRVTEGLLYNEPVTVLYPNTYMNHSGSAVAKLVPTTAVDRLIVVYDDVDLPFGTVKVTVGGGHAGHNGVRSVLRALGSPDFVRVRVGIAPVSFWRGTATRPRGDRLPTFVLQPFTRREQQQLPAVLARAGAALSTIVRAGVPAAMNECNAPT